MGDPETINSRTLLYLAMIGVGLLATAIAVTTARSVPGGPWARWPAAVLAFAVPVAVASLLLPGWTRCRTGSRPRCCGSSA